MNRNQNKKMQQEAAQKGAISALQAIYVDGLGIRKNALCQLFCFEDRLLIEVDSSKFEISFDRLRAAVVKSEQELIEQSKSVVGRAIIGTLLLPGLGTIVGGMSGIGTKKKKGKRNYYLILNYLDSKGDLKGITFKEDLNILRMNKFCQEINDSSNRLHPEIVQL
ncbi:hypothetical protein [Paenibacillus sp. N3.4]|uniref:hypothetical protein n=1 Tax=Paenibacillus sp. N3.4 TaxID=2603222 RepID=UPI00164FEB2C|nr:hypothetical protein [Paenibacillus sp. N3.4]